LYTCQDWFQTTLVDLDQSPTVEWCVAVMACLGAGLNSFFVSALRKQAARQFPDITPLPVSMGQSILLATLWGLFLIFLSIPTALYALSTNLPGDNILNLSQTVLDIFHEASSYLLFISLILISPPVSQWLVALVTGNPDPSRACQLQLVARLVVGLLVPTVVILIFDNGCLGGWLQLWSPCVNNSSAFDVTVDMHASGLTSNDTIVEGMFKYAGHSKYPYVVSNHSSICEPVWQSHRCSRSLVSALARLFVGKLSLIAVFSPAMTMLISMPVATRLFKKAFDALWPGRPFVWYQQDSEVSYVLMLVDELLSMGFMVPLLAPLISLAFATNCVAYHFSVHIMELPSTNAVRPDNCMRYLFASHAIGQALTIFIFFDNQLEGRIFLCVGIPLCSLLGWFAAKKVYNTASRTTGTIGGKAAIELSEPLLG